jgi:putative DNA primase/helicase
MKLRAQNGFVWGRARLSSAFKIVGLCRDMNNVGWGKLLEFSDPDGNVKREHFADADMHNTVDTVTGRLASAGLIIMPHQKNLVRDYIGGVTVAKRIRTVDRTGWHNGVFVLPDETIGDNGGEQTLLINVGKHGYAQSGSLEDWRNTVAKIAAPHRLARLAISTALSGPLLALVNGDSGGGHLPGLSSIGKTSDLRAAASVWGRGSVKDGYIKTWHSTANALEGSAAAASNTFLALDELSEASAADVAGIVYVLGNEGGKDRMRADITMRAAKTWRVAALSTGEKTLAQKIAENGGRRSPAGVEMRMINVRADSGCGYGVFDSLDGHSDGAALANALSKQSTTYYGTAGPAFVRAIIEHCVDKVREMAEGMVSAFVKTHAPKNANGQVMRVARRLGVISTAGELAIEFGVLPWRRSHAESAAAWGFKRWVEETGGAEGVIEDRQALEHVRELIEKYGDSRFDDVNVSENTPKGEPIPGDDPDACEWPEDAPFYEKGDERPVFTRYGLRRGEGDTRQWLVFPEMWKTEFCKGYDPIHIAGLLAAQGKLRKNGKNLQGRMNVNGKRHHGYILTHHILDEAEGEEDTA